MHRRSRSTRLLLTLLVGLGLSVAACGDDDDTVETDPAQEVEESEDMTEEDMTEDETTDDMTEEEMTEDETMEEDMEDEG